MEYLHSEKDKHQSQNYQKRIDDFNSWIHDSERRALELNEELGWMNQEWKDRLISTIRETEKTIWGNESAEHARKIGELTKALEDKNKEIDDLKRRRDELEREVQHEPTETKDAKINQKRDELASVIAQLAAALKEKNSLYDELTKNTKELLDTNE